jgi:hypothetical protein
MVLKGILFVILIITSAIALLVSFIFFVIRLANDHPKKWQWLIGVGISLVVLIGSVIIFAQKVVNKASEFGQNMQAQLEKSMEEGAVNSKQDYHYELLDSSSLNPTIAKLKDYERQNSVVYAPDEFYVYLGFMDYYRMPLTFPYSLHCNDVLESASLFNEDHVVDFNRSDNGETECGVDSIRSFAFDEKMLIAKQKINGEEKFTVYNFKNSGSKTYPTQKEAFKDAADAGYNGPDTLVTILQYYRLFNK